MDQRGHAAANPHIQVKLNTSPFSCMLSERGGCTMPLGTRIRKAREQADISHAELARRMGMSKNAMHAIEAGDTDPRALRIVAIAQERGLSTDALLLGTSALGKQAHKPPTL